MKKFLPFILFLVACNRDKDYRCICKNGEDRVAHIQEFKKAWKKKAKNYCENLVMVEGVTCRMYDEDDNIQKCLVTRKSYTRLSDTPYLFENVSEEFITNWKASKEKTIINVSDTTYIVADCTTDITKLY